MEKKTYKMTE